MSHPAEEVPTVVLNESKGQGILHCLNMSEIRSVYSCSERLYGLNNSEKVLVVQSIFLFRVAAGG